MTQLELEHQAKLVGIWCDIQFKAECRRLKISEVEARMAPLLTIGLLQEREKRK